MAPGPTARPVAFVTGASYGIGAATGLALARAGFDVAVSEPCQIRVNAVAPGTVETPSRAALFAADPTRASA